MLIDRVKDFVDSFNMRSDKVAFYTPVLGDDFPYHPAITVTREYCEDTRSWKRFTALPTFTTEAQVSLYNMPPKFPVIGVNVFDPKWGRSGWSKNGLFKNILEVLQLSNT